MPISLKPQDLAAACKQAVDTYSTDSNYQKWSATLQSFLEEVRATNHDEFVSPAFQEKLWSSEAVSATGMGSVNVEKVINCPEIAELLWKVKSIALPSSPTERTKFLKDAWDQFMGLVKPQVDRIPRLKMNRVFAALQPNHFTTVAHTNKLMILARAMDILSAKNLHVVELHQSVLDRLSDTLGLAPNDGVERMTLPWLLYALSTDNESVDATTETKSTAGTELLKPLPAARRRRGMLAIGGYFSSVLSMLEFAKEGCSREDLKAHIQSVNSNLKPSSVQTNLNALVAEWGALRPVGEHQLELTPRGEALLESGDPAEVSDWLLTRILGLDHILYALNSGEKSVQQLYRLLKEVCPSWTTDFASSSLVAWVRALGLATQDQNKILRLTEEGQNWAKRIHWVPEKITDIDPVLVVESSAKFESMFTPPNASTVFSALPSEATFPKKLVAQLHAGLWSNDLRHFAVLTGLSGAGKTLLARNYALALRGSGSEASKGLCVVPVQPGWHDPSCLLGYVNPLSDNAYVRTEFLNFLLDACSNPSQCYTVVLDEMNLSHPEQYLAPLLSAMETGGNIVLHMDDEDINGVPSCIAYPGNLLIIGTVNMDETTHGLSDKVLDRATVLEFWDIDVAAYPNWQQFGLSSEVIQSIKDALVKLGEALRPVRLHFGWRSIGDILGYVRTALASDILSQQEALDAAIYSKLLPKLRGEDTPRLRKAFEDAHQVLLNAGLVESAGKLNELVDDLKHLGSARFWR